MYYSYCTVVLSVLLLFVYYDTLFAHLFFLCVRVCVCLLVFERAVQLAFELGRDRNPSSVAYERRSKLAKARGEATEKTTEFNHWASEADKHIEHKVCGLLAAYGGGRGGRCGHDQL